MKKPKGSGKEDIFTHIRQPPKPTLDPIDVDQSQHRHHTMKTNTENTVIPESIATAMRACHVSIIRLADQLDHNMEARRRNIDPDTASMLRGMLYNGRKATKSEAQSKSVESRNSKDQSDTCKESTAETIAKQTGVSAPTTKRDAKFAEALERKAPKLSLA